MFYNHSSIHLKIMAEERTFNRIIGEFLGYPTCCIETFGDSPVFYWQRPLLVQEMSCNGFIPCPKCAEKLADNTISYEDLINPRRKCSVPFKKKHSYEENKTIDSEILALQNSYYEKTT